MIVFHGEMLGIRDQMNRTMLAKQVRCFARVTAMWMNAEDANLEIGTPDSVFLVVLSGFTSRDVGG
jgi:hypothetical protein